MITAWDEAIRMTGEVGDDGEGAYQVQIISHQGTTFRMEDFTTLMEVRVWQGGEEITDLFNDVDFRWYRTSDNTNEDTLWNSAQYATGGKTITITEEDVFGKTNFFCDLLSTRS